MRGVLVGLCLLLASASAAPAEVPRLLVSSCDPAMATALERQLGIELMSLRNELERLPPLAQLEVRVRCFEQRVELEVELTGRRSARQIDVTGAPVETHPRLVALAAGELIYGVVVALGHEADTSAARVVPEASEPSASRPEARDEPRVVHVSALGSIRRAGQPAIWLGGVGLGLDYAPVRVLAIAVDAELDLGSLAGDALSVHVIGLSGGAHALVGRHRNSMWWGIGPGVRVGWARLSGRPSEPQLHGESLSGAWGGPSILARFLYAPRGWPLAVSLAMDGGLVTVPLTGTRDRAAVVFALDGGWAGASVRVGW